jgi:excisionase family DNA binding protein
MTPAAVLDALDAVILTLRPEDLAPLLGRLDVAKARALARAAEKKPCCSAGTVAESEPLLSLPEVGRLLGESEHFARELGRRGELPLVRLGKRHVRVRPAALREWIRAREDPGVDTRLGVTYSLARDRRRAAADSKAVGPHSSAARGTTRDHRELRRSPGAGGNGHSGARRKAPAAAGGASVADDSGAQEGEALKWRA